MQGRIDSVPNPNRFGSVEMLHCLNPNRFVWITNRFGPAQKGRLPILALFLPSFTETSVTSSFEVGFKHRRRPREDKKKVYNFREEIGIKTRVLKLPKCPRLCKCQRNFSGSKPNFPKCIPETYKSSIKTHTKDIWWIQGLVNKWV